MFRYNWSLKDYPEKNNLKVFSCFACGGGSTMGYKLAGYDVIGMSVPPVMIANIAEQIKKQWFDKTETFINKKDLRFTGETKC